MSRELDLDGVNLRDPNAVIRRAIECEDWRADVDPAVVVRALEQAGLVDFDAVAQLQGAQEREQTWKETAYAQEARAERADAEQSDAMELSYDDLSRMFDEGESAAVAHSAPAFRASVSIGSVAVARVQINGSDFETALMLATSSVEAEPVTLGPAEYEPKGGA